MRLTCPRCNAQYEIPESAIPAMGREVECSACGNVWHQPRAAAAQTPQKPQEIAAQAQDYDASARPALNQPLSDSILSILREETARELSARSDAKAPAAPVADHIPATEPSAAPIPSPEPTPEPAGDQPVSISGNADFEWPVATVILPGEPLEKDAPETATPPKKAEKPAPPPVEPEVSAPQPDPLPDAARLAATLTRPAAPALRPAALDERPVPVETLTQADQTTPPVATAPQNNLPAIFQPKPRKGGYAMGFGLAVMLALAVVAFYALAPRLSAGADGSTVGEWRNGLDQGRLWLAEQFQSLRAMIFG
ncbi:zinc-ribbon domain-containing protein [Paracoccus laeviglucosivorans]|uniref:MJ0042 family finger-like domain-containing protein n=1 Tax=Paracoccus laeviglucosivorans TaxID=1197861 RepID=A0A521E933_9RHOB|nr:zinc-ribbon domain-containing protein [Paracoccus laeviglucosivorans]SMO79680.1 MJ0042 family finger-like domain-containing protein [Paracoccus laeviglucosivorans]